MPVACSNACESLGADGNYQWWQHVAVCGVVPVAAIGPVLPGCTCQRSRGTTTAVHGIAVNAILFSLTLRVTQSS